MNQYLFENTIVFPNITQSGHNYFHCDSYSEEFFDVFCIQANNTEYIKEKKGTINGEPVIHFDVKINEKTYKNVPFILTTTEPTILNESTLKSSASVVKKKINNKIIVENVEPQVPPTKIDKLQVVEPIVEVTQLSEQPKNNQIPPVVTNFDPNQQITILFEKQKDEFTKSLENISRTYTTNLISRLKYYSESGGGTNAYNYYNGGTIYGNLDITGTILSAGVELSTLFGSGGGGGSGDPYVNSLVRSSSASWTSASTTVATNSAQWGAGSDDIYVSNVVRTTSAAWNSNYTTVNTNSSRWSTAFLPTSGGTISGDLTITGNLTALGDFTQIDTIISTTSALSVVNNGTGPALVVKQTGSQNVADFYDDNVLAFRIADGGNVGINVSSPSQKLTVGGSISAQSNVYVGNTINFADVTISGITSTAVSSITATNVFLVVTVGGVNKYIRLHDII